MHYYKKQKPAERDKIKSAKQTHYSMLMKPAEKKNKCLNMSLSISHI